MNRRTRLMTAVVALTLVAAGLGFFLVAEKSAEAARARLLVDVILLAGLAGIVVAATRTPASRQDEIIDAMRTLARGARERRLDYQQFGDLTDVARAYNELAAALSEHDDPNLGPVKAKRRPSAPPWSDSAARESDHPELGTVRVISRAKPAAAPAEAKAGAKAAEKAAEEEAEKPKAPTTPPKPRSDPPRPAEPEEVERIERIERREPAPTDNDTTIDEAPRERVGEPIAAKAPEERPPPFDFKSLFQEFVEAKRAHDEATDDLELGTFQETLEEEMARLKDAHGCRAVRFEVRVQDGEVSLLPRLIR